MTDARRPFVVAGLEQVRDDPAVNRLPKPQLDDSTQLLTILSNACYLHESATAEL